MEKPATIYRYIDFRSAVRFFSTLKIRMSFPSTLNDIFELPFIYESDTPMSDAQERLEAEETFGVTCYSETPTNLLMWSHYADHHRGLVLGFDSNHPFFSNLKRVQYVDQYGKDDDKVEEAILRKGDPWMYEKEWRQIWKNPIQIAMEAGEITEPDCFLIDIPIETLKEVIYGVRYLENENISNDDIKSLTKTSNPFYNFIKIREWQKYDMCHTKLSEYFIHNLPDVKIFSAERLPNRYSLFIAKCSS